MKEGRIHPAGMKGAQYSEEYISSIARHFNIDGEKLRRVFFHLENCEKPEIALLQNPDSSAEVQAACFVSSVWSRSYKLEPKDEKWADHRVGEVFGWHRWGHFEEVNSRKTSFLRRRTWAGIQRRSQDRGWRNMTDGHRTIYQQLRQKAATGDVLALSELKGLADEGDGNPEALFHLGVLFDGSFPSTVATDPVAARQYYLRAARLGNKVAQLCIGNMCDYGEGGATDLVEARHWYSAAAEQGVRDAQMHYGRMLQMGRAGCEDKEEAAKWYLLAADQGDELAATNLAGMHIRGELHDSNPEIAVKLLQFSAEKLDGVAHLHLGNIYIEGVAAEFDSQRALFHYTIAALLLSPGTNKDIAVEGRDAMLDQHPDLQPKFEELALAYISEGKGQLPN